MTMKALILVGGYGTRLRPLTLTKVKPMVEFCNQPIVCHQIQALAVAGVKHVVLAVCYQAEQMLKELKEFTDKLDIKITVSQETQPLGTAGAIALAHEQLEGSTFFVLNSDIICPFPFVEMAAFHRQHGKEGTIVVTKVDEPLKYGVVGFDSESKLVECFNEKPKNFITNTINAGLYIFSPTFLSRVKPVNMSIEKKYSPLWLLTKIYALLNCKDSTAKVSDDCVIGPDVVIGANCIVEKGCKIQKSVLMASSHIGSHSWINNSIIGWDAKVGEWCRVDNVTVLGEKVEIKKELYVNGARVLPHKVISESILTPSVVL